MRDCAAVYKDVHHTLQNMVAMKPATENEKTLHTTLMSVTRAMEQQERVNKASFALHNCNYDDIEILFNSDACNSTDIGKIKARNINQKIKAQQQRKDQIYSIVRVIFSKEIAPLSREKKPCSTSLKDSTHGQLPLHIS